MCLKESEYEYDRVQLLNLYSLCCRMDKGGQHVVNIWNDVPEDISTETTAMALKNLVEAHLLNFL